MTNQPPELRPVEVTQEEFELAVEIVSAVSNAPLIPGARTHAVGQILACRRLNTRPDPPVSGEARERARELITEALRFTDGYGHIDDISRLLREALAALSSPANGGVWGGRSLESQAFDIADQVCPSDDPMERSVGNMVAYRAAKVALSSPARGRQDGIEEAAFRAGYEAAKHAEGQPAYTIGLDPAGDAWDDYAALALKPAEGVE